MPCHPRRPYLLTVLAASCWAAGVGTAVGQETIATSQGVPGQRVDFVMAPFVDHFKGVTVWSERVPGPGGAEQQRHFLTTSIGGVRVRLPIEPRLGVPFDADLGPDADGNVVAVYSRCRVEPTDGRVTETVSGRVPASADPTPAYSAGRGCDLFRFDFKSGRETRIAGASTSGASEMLPSIWEGRIAFVRVYERRSGDRGRYPYIYTRSLGGGTSVREPGGSRGIYGLPGPTSLDLYGRKLSFAWNYVTGDPRDRSATAMTELRLNFTGSSKRRLLGQRDSGSYLSPTGSRGRIHYGYQRVEDGSTDQRGGPSSESRARLSYDISDGERSISRVPGELLVSMAVDGRTIVYGVADDDWGTAFSAKVLRDQL
ncbi:MAG: hypothetical protein WKF96_10115 [Solirubrobacteraceae bacterium]